MPTPRVATEGDAAEKMLRTEGDAAEKMLRMRSEEAPPLTVKVPALDPFAGWTVSELIAAAKDRLEQRDANGAMNACDAARKLGPTDGEVLALGAWARFQAGHADIKALTIELDELIQEADHANARFFRAMMRRRLSDEAGAIRDLRRAIELDPSHVDAVRELAGLQPTASALVGARPSLLGRLFKR